MVSKTWKSLLCSVAISGAMVASAQTPTSAQTQRMNPAAPLVETFTIFPSKDPARLRKMAILQTGLNSGSLDLTTAQKAKIDKILDDLVSEVLALQETDPVEKGKSLSQTGIEKRQAVASKFTASVGNVMNAEQRRTWEFDKAARRSALERNLSKGAAARK